MSTIRDRQIAALKRMLNLGKVATKKSAIEPEWKVLVYDKCGQNIISPLLSVAELRELGITLYLPLDGARDAISDVTAVYFVYPNEENISRICKDMQDQMYDNYHFNFISAISRTKLEEVAAAALQADIDTQTINIFDQYINFVSLEQDLFVVRAKGNDLTSYYNLNKSDLKDYEMMSIIDSLVDSLYCVFVSLGAIPIIRSPAGNAAEMVAEKLDKKFRENLKDARNSFFSAMPGSDMGQQFSSFQRPLLLLVDRNADLATPLHHTWTYQSLVHDVLDFSLNTATVIEEPAAGSNPQTSKSKTKVFSLSQSDKFWQQYKGYPFPEVAQAVQEEIEEYKKHEGEVQRLKSVMGLSDNDSGPVDISDNTAKLTSAMSSLPELLEKKRLIDMHTTIATSVLGSIKERKLDEYFEMEEKIMSKTAAEKALLDLISDPSGGTPEDKMRLFLIYFLCQGQSGDSNFGSLIEALEASGCDMAPYRYIKRWKQYSMPTSQTSQQQYRGGGIKTVGMFSHLMSTGSQFVMEGVKNLVVKKHNLPITKILDSLMELKTNAETENYRYFDPKLSRSLDSAAGRTKLPYSDAIVFVVGGGNYTEYHNIMDYTKSKPGKRVSYGCSDLSNATQFLDQLCMLGKEIE